MKCTNERGKFCKKQDCERCGFNPEEAERRKDIPLTECDDGLRRKILGGQHEA